MKKLKGTNRKASIGRIGLEHGPSFPESVLPKGDSKLTLVNSIKRIHGLPELISVGSFSVGVLRNQY